VTFRTLNNSCIIGHSTAVVKPTLDPSQCASGSAENHTQPQGMPGQRRRADGAILRPKKFFCPTTRPPAKPPIPTLKQLERQHAQGQIHCYLKYIEKQDEILRKCIEDSDLPKPESMKKERRDLMTSVTNQATTVNNMNDLMAFLGFYGGEVNFQKLHPLEKFRPLKALGEQLSKLKASPETDETRLSYIKAYGHEMYDMVAQPWVIAYEADANGLRVGKFMNVKESISPEKLRITDALNAVASCFKDGYAVMNWSPQTPQI
jgi:hypothetical protein